MKDRKSANTEAKKERKEKIGKKKKVKSERNIYISSRVYKK